MRIKHREKLRMARRMAPGKRSGVFTTPQWLNRAKGIWMRVKRMEYAARVRANRRRLGIPKEVKI